MAITHVFFDIGGVLGTNGWDHEQRAEAAGHFGLGEEFEHRHHEIVGEWEAGLMSFDEYLDTAVFYEKRSFSREEFVAFMMSLSKPFEDSLALVRRLAEEQRVRLYTLNNEAEALNVHRLESFGLRGMFEGFFSSCWLGVRKPSHRIFHRAISMTQTEPGCSLFVDDREQNIAPAERLGFGTVLFRGAKELESELKKRGVLS